MHEIYWIYYQPHDSHNRDYCHGGPGLHSRICTYPETGYREPGTRPYPHTLNHKQAGLPRLGNG